MEFQTFEKNTVKMADLPVEVALKVFEMLNDGKVTIKKPDDDIWTCQYFVYTDTEPKDLAYPEGWYYHSNGYFTNKHHSSSGRYCMVTMMTYNHTLWRDKVNCAVL